MVSRFCGFASDGCRWQRPRYKDLDGGSQERCVAMCDGHADWRGVPKWLKVVRVLSTFVTTADWYSSHFLSNSSHSCLAVFCAWRDKEDYKCGTLPVDSCTPLSAGWNVVLQTDGLPPAAHTMFLISSFRRVQNVVCFLLGDSPASDLYMPTFRNTLSVPSSKAGVKWF